MAARMAAAAMAERLLQRAKTGAARLLPAPSARRSQRRVVAMEQDPKLMARTETCRQIQQCHRLYARAERIAPVRPEKAQELWDEVVRLAPHDTPLWKAARQQLDQHAR